MAAKILFCLSLNEANSASGVGCLWTVPGMPSAAATELSKALLMAGRDSAYLAEASGLPKESMKLWMSPNKELSWSLLFSTLAGLLTAVGTA